MPRNHKIETRFGEVTDERAALPFYGMVSNLDYTRMLQVRIAVRERCIHDLGFRNDIIQAVSKDCALFAFLFAVIHETRATEKNKGSFHPLLDPDQADVLACLQKYGGYTDITIEKSRGLGLSYLACIYLLWLWLFQTAGKIEAGALSKDEASLDSPRRPSSLMGKLDLLFENLPAWLRLDDAGKSLLRRTSTDHKFENLRNGNAILGFVPTADKLRSSRIFCLIADEAAFLPFETQRWLAAAHGTTPSIIWVSTHDGTANLFYRLTQNDSANLVRISTWWHNNPRCRSGLYRSVNSQIEILDTEYEFPEDYEFSHDHAPLLRSPWADRYFDRPEADKARVLQELYGLAVINQSKLFQGDTIEAATRTIMGPVFRGDYIDDEFVETFSNPPLHAFTQPEVIHGRMSIGCDPSTGVAGGANGGLCLLDMTTGEQLASGLFASCDAIRLAAMAVSLAKRFSQTDGSGFGRIVYESTGGVGATFAAEIARLKFPEAATVPLHNKDRGESWLVELARAIRDGEVVVRDARVLAEMRHFVYSADYKLEYTSKDGHGDGAIALALAWQYVKKFRKPPKTNYYPRGLDFEHPGNLEPKIVSLRRKGQTWSNRFRSTSCPSTPF